MTRFSLLLLLLVSLATACKKQIGCTDPSAVNYNPDAKKSADNCVVPEPVNKVLLVKFTAVWCPPCGGWGADAFKQFKADYANDVIAIASHGSQSQPDALTTDASLAMFSNFPVTGFPNFLVGSQFQGATNNISQAMSDALAKPVEVGGAMVFEQVENKYIVDAKVEFFSATQGDFYLSVFVLENGIPGGDNAGAALDQKGDNSNSYTHNNVLRAHGFGQPFGQSIASGSIGGNAAYNLATQINIESDWNTDNQTLVGVIWKKTGGAFEAVNAFEGIDKQDIERE